MMLCTTRQCKTANIIFEMLDET
uniref:Uncharacterized protein n=1 Tax=Nelumbo nucifera TaxID=4432 RepID=A0A823A1F5_NELNU|nr:TPA_asm: hypothetical protein HUJ06_010074 [Nelumbo nucifera]DAD44367.1 TPA_asm: hypothetical protein HUJ06_002597 [Nelumbo nucifera]DAD44760.1 TPA_asm: hypothetical protein HUJ06_002990 [Nelumbo nucifera]DAD48836.1 TPA_asm: hypothetical protein HUJ06_018773 [Nelumbo nucifera]DAD48837.1 TPA_asm: hypothetical protein HUJ06_018774 [Nelumbo nucifera]